MARPTLQPRSNDNAPCCYDYDDDDRRRSTATMSSAVPIHPMLRLARQRAAASRARHLTNLPCRLLSSSPSPAARPTGKAGARASREEGSSKGVDGSGSSSSPSGSSPPSSGRAKSEEKAALESAAVRSYSASSRANPASPPPGGVKLTDKRKASAAPRGEQESASGEEAREVKDRHSGQEQSEGNVEEQATEGGVQKMLKGASMRPAAAAEQSRQTEAAAATTTAASSSPSLDSGLIDGEGESGKNRVAEGIVIPAQRASTNYASSASPSSSSSDPSQHSSGGSDATSSGSRSGEDGIVDSFNSGGNTHSEDGSSGPPATTHAPELGSTRPPNPLHPFDTHVFVKRLQSADFLAKRAETGKGGVDSTGPAAETTSLSSTKRHDPAEAIMEATRHLLVSRGGRVLDHHISKTEVENQAYLFTAALSELRTELQVRARNDAAALRSMVTLLQREVDGLNQKMREDVAGMKHDIQVDMNNRKGEAKEEQNTLEQEIQDLNNRFTISISDLKTEIEQNIKWDATRRALTVVFGCVVILIATLTAADYLTREEAEEVTATRSQKEASTFPHSKTGGDAMLRSTKSAEELGLVANYDEGDASRYV